MKILFPKEKTEVKKLVLHSVTEFFVMIFYVIYKYFMRDI